LPEKNIGLGGIGVKPERLRALRPAVVAELADSMARIGQLQPIIIRARGGSGYWLVVGRHRFEAARKLKWASIRANVVDDMKADEAELAEIDENLVRAELSDAERALHNARRKELYEKVHPETIKGATGRGRKKSQIGTSNAPAFIDDTATKTGKGRSTVARDVTRAKQCTVLGKIIGTSLDSGSEIDALAKMSKEDQENLATRARDGETISARTELKKQRRKTRESELAVKQIAMPQKSYGVILADPPWQFTPRSDETGMDRAADNHYQTMGTDAIAALTLPAAPDCVCFLWATVPMLPEALRVLEAWGFSYKSNFAWIKDKDGTGFWSRNRHELLLIGAKGTIPAPAHGEQYSSVIEAPRGEHSAKPFVVHEMIETMFPTLPRIELFAREKFEGWESWGNEVADAAE
jgi:N6-adenosine-specific RNA methylase IME4